MTDTDRATEDQTKGLVRNEVERLAEALEKLRTSDQHITGVPMFSEVLMETLIQYLIAQGFGHQDDILRAFAEWLGTKYSYGYMLDCNSYLASFFAANEEEE